MLDRLIALFQAILNALLGHADNPADMLEQTYEELQQTLIRVRQDLPSQSRKKSSSDKPDHRNWHCKR